MSSLTILFTSLLFAAHLLIPPLQTEFFTYLPVVLKQSQSNATPVPTPTPTPVPPIRPEPLTTTEISLYDSVTLDLDVTTASEYPYLPYDANPPAGLEPEMGVSVDALFTVDNWQTVITQPAFFYQPYTFTVREELDLAIPNGAPHWRVRFTPRQTGTWQYQFRMQDSAGVEVYPPVGQTVSFTVSDDLSDNSYFQRGFLRVSETDPRYFEFDDGSPFIGVGFNDGVRRLAEMRERWPDYEANKVNFLRIWMSSESINGSHWTSWHSHHLDFDGYLPGVDLETEQTFNGADVAYRLDDNTPCLFSEFNQPNIAVEPSTGYSFTVRLKAENIQGAGDYGVVLKQSNWLGPVDCATVNGTLIVGPVTGTTEWMTATGFYTTHDDASTIDYLYLAREDATGVVYIDEVTMTRRDDPHQVNMLSEPNANSHLYFDQRMSALWDEYIHMAEQHGTYLKLVTDEKNEWIRNRINADGAMTSDGSNDNFYAAPNTKVRWLQEAWWRYLIARWGYSPIIHSFEYVNEGDPFNGNHYKATTAMADYFAEHDPHDTMVTTSFWHSFPNQLFWSNSDYASVDYADLHAYIRTGFDPTTTFIDEDVRETDPAHVFLGTGSAVLQEANRIEGILPQTLRLQGAGEWLVQVWMKAENYATRDCRDSESGSQKVRWSLNGGLGNDGLEGTVPAFVVGDDIFDCVAPAGTFDWTLYRSDRDRTGAVVPESHRLILPDDEPYQLELFIQHGERTSGSVWFDEITLTSPDGLVVPIIGSFDHISMADDSAWYYHAYSALWGSTSPVGVQRKPFVRGESGITVDTNNGGYDWDRDLLSDWDGFWLHHQTWAQTGPGGMYDLAWWRDELISPNLEYGRTVGLYNHYLTYRNFMEDIPINNGNYVAVEAQLMSNGQPITRSNSNQLRVWGQRDDVNGRAHMWLHNPAHTWRNIVDNVNIDPITDTTVILPNMANGTYQIRWWDTYKIEAPVVLTETVAVTDGNLNLTLPYALESDIAVKVDRAE